jgi:hypothetical protein
MYPIKVEYINYNLVASLDFTIVTPSGEIITDFGSTIVNFNTDDIINCAESKDTNKLYSESAHLTATVSSVSVNTYNLFDINTAQLTQEAHTPSTITTSSIYVPKIKARYLEPTVTYAYTGTLTITSGLVYTTLDAGKLTTITDIAVLEPETTITTWIGTTTSSVIITTTAIDPEGIPVLTTYTMVELPSLITASHTYAYSAQAAFTSTFIDTVTDAHGVNTTISGVVVQASGTAFTSTLIYITTYSHGVDTTITDIALLVPETTLTTWTGTTTSSVLITTTAIDANGKPVLTTYTMLEVPSDISQPSTFATYAYTGDATIKSTLVYTHEIMGLPFLTTETAVLVPETTLSTWTGTATSSVLISTSAIDANGKPVLTTYTMLEIPSATSTLTASNTYAYAGESTITSIRVYATLDADKFVIVTDVAVLEPVITLSTWTGSFTTSVIITATMIDSNGNIVLPTYTMLKVPSRIPPSTVVSSTTDVLSTIITSLTASNTYAYTGTSTTTTTLFYSSTDAAGKLIRITDVAVLVPEKTLTIWTGNFTTSVVSTTTAIDANGKPIVTTYTMVQLPFFDVSTSVWSNSFASTLVTTVGTNLTTIFFIPSSSAAATFTIPTTATTILHDTITWSNSYASTITATLGTTVSTIVCIPSSSTIITFTKVLTECTQCQTSIWFKSFVSTATTTVSGVISTIFYVPNSASTLLNQNTIDTITNKLSDSTETTSIIPKSSQITDTTVTTTPICTSTTTGILSETTVATYNSTPTDTSIAYESTEVTASTVSSHLTFQPSVTVYEASGYKLKNSIVVALVAYMLAI